MLQKTQTQRRCKILIELCHRHNDVYGMKCTGCGANYIGMTTRMLHTRVREHLTRPASAVKQHGIECRSPWEVNVLSTAGSTLDLQLKEALLIEQRRPRLNNRNEMPSLKII